MAQSEVKVRVRTDGTAEARAGLDQVSQSVTGINQAAELASKAFQFLSSEFTKMSEKYATSAKLDAVLASTKGAAGMTREALDKLTGSLAQTTLMSVSMIREGEHMLLTFTQIGKEVFPQATETAMNMSVAFGTDAKTAAIQLGKALNDPTVGMNALRRVGVSFSAEQKKQIKQMQESGDLMGAQKLILSELQTEFGGLAKKMAETPTGRIEMFTKALGAAKEMFLDMMLKGLKPAIDGLSVLTGWIRSGLDALGPFKGILTVVVGTFGLLVAAIAAFSLVSSIAIVKTTLLTFWMNAQRIMALGNAAAQWLMNAPLVAYNAILGSGILVTIGMTIAKGAAAVVTGVMTAAQWLLNAAMSANPIGIVVLLLGLLIGGLGASSIATKGWTKTLNDAWEILKKAWEISMRFLNPIGLMITLGQLLYQEFPLVREVFDSVWQSLKTGYEALKAAYDMGVKFLGLGPTAKEEQAEAAAKKKKALVEDFEMQSKFEEDKSKKTMLEIDRREALGTISKKVAAAQRLQEEGRYYSALWRMADKAGEDSLEFQTKAAQAYAKLHELDVNAAKDAADKKKKMQEEHMAGIKKTNDFYKQMDDDAQKMDEDAEKEDATRWKKEFQVLKDQWEQAEAEKAAIQEAALKRVEDKNKARQIGIGLLPTEKERIDAKLAYELEALNEQYMTGEILEQEFVMKSKSLRRSAAKEKSDIEIDQAKELFNQLGGMVDKNSAAGKAVSVAQAIMNTWEGATKALAQGGILGPILAGVVIASGMASVAKIMAVQPGKTRASGGPMSGGLYAVNERGQEYAMNADATAKYRPILDALNAGATPGQISGRAPNVQSAGMSNMAISVTGRLVADGGQLVAVIEHAMPRHLSSMG